MAFNIHTCSFAHKIRETRTHVLIFRNIIFSVKYIFNIVSDFAKANDFPLFFLGEMKDVSTIECNIESFAISNPRYLQVKISRRMIMALYKNNIDHNNPGLLYPIPIFRRKDNIRAGMSPEKKDSAFVWLFSLSRN